MTPTEGYLTAFLITQPCLTVTVHDDSPFWPDAVLKLLSVINAARCPLLCGKARPARALEGTAVQYEGHTNR